MTSDKKPTNAFASLKAVAQPTIPEAPAEPVQAASSVVQLVPAGPEKMPPAASAAPLARVQKARAKKFTRPGREGMKVIAVHVSPDMARQLKILAAETDGTIQQLVEDAIRDRLIAAGKEV